MSEKFTAREVRRAANRNCGHRRLSRTAAKFRNTFRPLWRQAGDEARESRSPRQANQGAGKFDILLSEDKIATLTAWNHGDFFMA